MACLVGSLAPGRLQAQNVTLAPTITTVAGNGTYGFSGDAGPATSAELFDPGGMAADSAGNLYIADYLNSRVRKVDTSGNITTVAGNGTAGYNGDNIPATSAELNTPTGVAVDGAGNVYIADYANQRVRKVDVNGIISTVAGNGTQGYNGDSIAATSAELSGPHGVALDGAGNLYIADIFNERIRKVDAGGNITTVAGNGTRGYNGDNIAAVSAELDGPEGAAVDSAGNLYIADYYNARVRRVDTSGNITTVAGNGTRSYNGDNIAATSAELNLPTDVAVDSAGNLYIADVSNERVRKVDASGTITTVAGNGTNSYNGDSIAASSAELSNPMGVAIDKAGNLYIGDFGDARVRKVTNAESPVNFRPVDVGANSTQNVFLSINTALTLTSVGTSGDFSVQSDSCALNTPLSAGTLCTLQVQFAPTKPGQRWFPLVATDSGANLYSFGLEGTGVGSALALTPGIIATVAGTGTAGYNGDNIAATSAGLYYPQGVAVDSAGSLYIADTDNSRIRKVDAGGIITTVAGNGAQGYNGDNIAATSAELYNPNGVAVDSAGNLYIADMNNNRIRKVDASGIITTVAGNGTFGYNGDNIAATSAELWNPATVAVDSAGNLYIADDFNYRVRKVDTNGVITTMAGTGTAGYNGDNIAATSAELYHPHGAALDSAGNLYIADEFNARIRKVDASGIITTVAGNGTAGYNGDDIPATSAELYNPFGVAVDSAGNLYIADFYNARIRKVDASGIITTLAGNGTQGYNEDNIPATSAELSTSEGVAVDSAGSLYIADTYNDRVRKVNVATSALSFGSVNVGQSSGAQSVAVSDVGTAALNFSSIVASTNFVIQSVGNDCAVGTPLAVGATCAVGVAFAPTTTGNPLSGTVTVSDDAFNTPQAVSLSGTGTPPAPTSVSISPNPLIFPDQEMGTLSAPLALTLTNSGAAALEITALTIGGTNSADFAPAAGGTCGSLPISVNIGQSCTVLYTFMPSTSSSESAALQVTDNAGTGSQMVSFAGNGTSGPAGTPMVMLSPAGPLTFGPEPVGTPASAQMVTVSNTGTATLVLTGITATGSGFGLGPATTCPTGSGELAVGANCALSVTFTPLYAGTVTGQIAIADNFAPSPQTIFLTGTGGMPNASLSATTLTLGGQQLTTTSSGKGVTLTNTGGAPLTITSVVPGGANPGDFGESDNCTSASPIAAGGSCTITITFTPTAVARRSANVTISDNDSTGAQTVFFSGLGNTPATGYGYNIITTFAGGGQPSGSAVAANLPSVGDVKVDSSGNLIVTLGELPQVVKVNTAGNVSVIAGSGVSGYSGDGGPATSAALSFSVGGTAVDGAGNVFIADANCVVRRVDAATGIITTVAGNGNCTDAGDGGPATSASVSPIAVALDHAGNLFISDSDLATYGVIRRVDATTGIITTIAGNFSLGFGYSGDNGPATSARMVIPEGIALDDSGNLFITDTYNCVIRRVDATTGIITTVAGDFSLGCSYNGDGTLATSATLNLPTSVAVDAAGDLYIADGVNFIVRRVAATTHIITTVAGTPGVAGFSGDGGAATSAKLNCYLTSGICDEFVDLAFGIALDGAGNLFIADTGNNRVRRVDASTGKITTVAGGGLGDGGSATSALFGEPTGLAASPAGDVFIGDNANERIRKVSASTGAISTVAGNGVEGSSGDGGLATSATLASANGIARDSSGNLYISDGSINNRVRRLDAVTGVITTVAGGGTGGDGGAATSAALNTPTGLALDGAGNLFIADSGNNRIRRVDAVTGIITTVAGGGSGCAVQTDSVGDGCPATSAKLSNPRSLAFDDAGNLYIADTSNHRIRVVSGGIISTYAGNGTGGASGDGGPATAARLSNPRGIAFGTFGNLFISDSNNGRIRRVYAATGTITTVAGNGIAAFAGDGGDAVLASFDSPAFLAVDGSDNLYVADEINNRIRRVQFQPSASASPASLTFPATAVGVTSAAQDITLTNSGGAMTVSSIVAAGNFTETDNCVGVVAPGLSCTISVTFTPAATGTLNGSITINDNAGTGSQLVTLTGTGTTTAAPVVSLLPASVSFGNVVESTTSGAIAVTLTNVGTPPLMFSSNPGISGANMGDFAIVSSTCSTATAVAAGGSCTVMVTFTPTTLTMETASLNFADNATPPSQSVALSGTGVSSSGTLPVFSSITLPSGALGVLYGADIQVTGGTQPYTFAVTSGSLPVGFSMTATGSNNVSPGHVYSTSTPPATGTFTFGVTVTDFASNMSTATISLTIGTAPPNTQPSLLKGQYALLLEGFGDSSGNEEGLVGSLTFDGIGTVTGVVDDNGTGGVSTSVAVTGTYSVGPDNRGFLVLNAAGQSGSFYAAMAVGNVYRGVASTVRLTQFNDNDGNDKIGSGFLRLQDPTAFNQNSLAGTFVFGDTGQTPTLQRVTEAGLISFDNALHVPSGTFDINQAGTTGSATLTGTYTAPDTNGRSVLSLTITPGSPTSTVLYQISANEAVFLTLDPLAKNDLLLGSALRQPNPNTFANSSITGPDVIRLNGTSGSGTANAIIGLATAVTTPSPTLTINYDNNDSGTVSTNQIISGAYSVATNGRASGTLTGTSGSTTLIFYLAQPDRGFVISGGNSAVAGQLVPQVGAPFGASPFNNNLFFGVQETVTAKEAISGIGVIPAPGTLNVTGDDSHAGGRLAFGENLALNYTVALNGHFTIPQSAGVGGGTGYVVSPYETDFLDAGSGVNLSTHPNVYLVQSIAAPPGTPTPAAPSVNFPTPVPIGMIAQSAPITITNTGLGPLGFTGVNTAASPDFSASGTCIPVGPVVVVVVQPQATCTIIITFAPTAGTMTGTQLNETLVAQTDGTSNVTFTLTGTAFPAGSGCSVTWTGAASGQWGTAANWSTGAVPIATDNVCVASGFTVTVGALAAANQTINSLTVLGSSTLAFTSGPLTVTTTASIPTLNVTGGTITFSGSAVITTALSISNGTASFNGPTTLAALTLNGGTLTGTSNLTVTGAFNWTGGTLSTTGTTTATGGINISGTGTTVTLGAGTLSSTGHTIQNGTSTLRIENGAVFSQTATAIYDAQSVFGITTATTGTFNNAGTFNRSGAAGGALPVGVTFNNTGAVNVQISELDFNAGGSCPTGGSITLASGVILGFNAGTFNMACALSGAGNVNTVGGTFNFATGASATGVSSLFVATTTTIASGVNLGIATVNVQTGGTLEGTGTITGNVSVIGGTVHPGMSPGTLTVMGNYTQTGGTLAMDLAGTTAGTGYSQLVVSSTATLGGVLNVSYFGGFMAAAGNSFTLIQPGAVSGTFASTILPAPPSGSTFMVSYAAAPTGVVLTAVPPAVVTALSFNPVAVTGGTSSTGTVTIDQAAPAGGIVVSLGSSDPSVTVPASVTVLATKTSQTFTATTVGVANATVVTVTATLGASNQSGTLTVNPAVITSLTFSPGSVTGGVGSVGTLVLSGPAPPVGLTVTLMSNNAAAATVPASFNIAGGASSGTFNVTTIPVAASASVTITATLPSGTALGGGLTVNPPVVTTLSFSPANVVSGQASTGTVVLNGNAPAGGLTVGLMSSNSSAFPVPASVVVPAGTSSQTFMVTGGAVATATPVTVTATTGTTMVTGNVTVLPPTAVTSLSFNPAAVTGGTSSTGTVTISQVAPAGGITVSLSSGDPSVTVPGTVIILAGNTSQTFTATTVGVATQTIVTVTATLGASNVTGTLTVNPAGITSLTFSPGSVSGGVGSVGTLVLSGPAPPTGLTVTLMSNNPSAATVPASFNVAGGATSGTFNVTTLPVAASTAVSITATLPSGTFLSGGLTVIPPVVTMLSFNPATVVPGQMTTGTVTLNGNAPAGGITVSLTSNNAGVLPVPANVTVLVNTNSQTFQVTAGAVAASTTVTVTATTGTTSLMANVTVVALTGLSFVPAAVTGGTTSTGTVTIGSAAPAGGFTVSLSSGDPSVMVPAAVTIAAGSTSQTFTATTVGVATQTIVTVMASLGTSIASGSLTVNPAVITSITFNPSPVVGGNGSVGTVALNGPAPLAGFMVILMSNNTTVATVLGSFNIAGAAISGTFSITTTTVTASTNVTITATLPTGTMLSSVLIVNPPGPPPAFTFTVPPGPNGGNGAVVTLVPGDTAVFTMTITPDPGFIGTITLACGALSPPTNTTICTVAPTSIKVTTSPSPAVPVTLTFQTNCVIAQLAPRAPWPQAPVAPAPLPLAAAGMLAFLVALRWRKAGAAGSRRYAGGLVPACAVLLLLLLVTTWAACVTDPPPLIPNAPTTPAGTYTLPVTATGPGGVTKTVTLTINVT